MRRVFSENIGESKLIIAQNADGYVGTIWQAGQTRETIEHADLEILKASLRNLAVTLHPIITELKGQRGVFVASSRAALATQPISRRNATIRTRHAAHSISPCPLTVHWKQTPAMPSVAARVLRPIFCRASKPLA